MKRLASVPIGLLVQLILTVLPYVLEWIVRDRKRERRRLTGPLSVYGRIVARDMNRRDRLAKRLQIRDRIRGILRVTD